MASDPQSRLAGRDVQPAQPERPSGIVPEELTEPGAKQDASDTDWLSMSTADPAFFLKDSGTE
jgi:hypothetical protein